MAKGWTLTFEVTSLLDLAAVDPQKLPRNVIDAKLATQYQVLVLGKRGNRLFIAGADPTDQEAVERIKFATQLTPEWVIVEHDKLLKLVDSATATAGESLEALVAGDFEFAPTARVDRGHGPLCGRGSVFWRRSSGIIPETAGPRPRGRRGVAIQAPGGPHPGHRRPRC